MAWEKILELAHIDDFRLARELNRRLRSTKTIFWKDEAIADCEDNNTRQRATELLADVLGRRKSAVDIKHSGSIGATVVHVYLPDNGRGDTFKPEGEDAGSA